MASNQAPSNCSTTFSSLRPSSPARVMILSSMSVTLET